MGGSQTGMVSERRQTKKSTYLRFHLYKFPVNTNYSICSDQNQSSVVGGGGAKRQKRHKETFGSYE